MVIDFEEITSQLEHKGLKGKGREGVVGRFLSKYLPASYEFIYGTIISASGEQSKEQDIIIADNSRLVKFLDLQSVSAVPVESVLVTIEIKSNLTSEELSNSLKNIHSVRSLAKHYFGNPHKASGPYSFIFAFSSSITIKKVLEILRSECEKIPFNYFPSAIICLDRGSILLFEKTNLNIVTLTPGNSVTLGSKHSTDPGYNLMMLYLLVATALFSSRPDQAFPDLLTYAVKSGFIVPETTIATEDLSDTYCLFKGKKISSNDVVKATDLIKKLFEKEEIADSEIIWLFYKISQYPYTESFKSESVYFVENGHQIIPWSTKEIFDAITRQQEGRFEEGDQEKLNVFCKTVREIINGEKYVEAGDIEIDARPGKKYIQSKGCKPI